jgi:hypothetical protein
VEPRYSLAAVQVCPPPAALTETDARHLIAEGLLRPTHEHGPTRVALTIGSDEKTVRRARDKGTTLRVDFVFNLLLVDDRALDPILAHFGKSTVDIDPLDVSWSDLGAYAGELSTEIHKAARRGHVSHQDLPRLRELARSLARLCHAAGASA